MATTRMKAGSVEGAVRVTGLTELNKALRALDSDLAKELRLAGKEVATMVASHARSKAIGRGGVSRHVAPSIKASAGATSAGVAFGGGAYPMAAGAEFGSVNFPQFDTWTGNGPDAGYFVYPAIRDDSSEIEAEFTDAINRLIEKAGLAP